VKGLTTFLVMVCFTTAWFVFSTGCSLFAQEGAGETRDEPSVSTAEVPLPTMEGLRKQLEALQKEIEELRSQIRETRKESPSRTEAPVEAPKQVELKVEPPRVIGSVGRRTPTVELGISLPEPVLAAQRLSQPAPTPPMAEGTFPEPFAAPPMIGAVLPGESVPRPGVPGGMRILELRRQELDYVLRSQGDVGLVTLLRFEKAKVCRKAGMYEEALKELKKVIEENTADETTIAARWTLVEILQEQKRNEEAIAELQEIFVSASDVQDRKDAMYGIINLSGEGPKARMQAIDRLIEALLKERAAWDECMRNLERLHAAERKYAEEHAGRLSDKLSDLYPEYVDDFEVFTCPATKGPKITRKDDIDSLTSYLLVAKGQPADTQDAETEAVFAAGWQPGMPGKSLWIREKGENHGRRWLAVYRDGSTGWIGAPRKTSPSSLSSF